MRAGLQKAAEALAQRVQRLWQLTGRGSFATLCAGEDAVEGMRPHRAVTDPSRASRTRARRHGAHHLRHGVHIHERQLSVQLGVRLGGLPQRGLRNAAQAARRPSAALRR